MDTRIYSSVTQVFRGQHGIPILLSIGFTCIICYLLAPSWERTVYNAVDIIDDDPCRVDFETESVRALAKQVAKINCKLFPTSSGAFCLTDSNILVGGNALWSLSLAQKIEGIVGNHSLLDLGAGLGLYGRYFTRTRGRIFVPKFSNISQEYFFQKPGVAEALQFPRVIGDYKAYDGGVGIEEFTDGFVSEINLANKVNLRKYDFVLSLELAEHVPKAYESILLDNIVSHACSGIILSWAVKGQDGHYHVNNQNNDYVERQMNHRGFIRCSNHEAHLRENPELSWFANTIMVFLRSTIPPACCPQSSVPLEC